MTTPPCRQAHPLTPIPRRRRLPPACFSVFPGPAPPPQVPATIATGTGRRAAYLTAAINREIEYVTSATDGGPQQGALHRRDSPSANSPPERSPPTRSKNC